MAEGEGVGGEMTFVIGERHILDRTLVATQDDGWDDGRVRGVRQFPDPDRPVAAILVR